MYNFCMGSVWHFIRYNNAVPIGLFILFGGTGAAFAASPQVQQAVYSTQDTVKTVDNTYIVSADLAHYNFNLQINSVTEDSDNYYIAYSYKTIQIDNYVWKDVPVSENLKLSKKELEGHDLGTYVAGLLGNEIKNQLAYLSQVQQKQRDQGITLKTVSTEYSGLIGKMFDPTEKSFPGYVPVVAEAPSPSQDNANADAEAAAVAKISLPPIPTQDDIQNLVSQAVQNALAQHQNASSTQDTAQATSTTPTTTSAGAPVITINGANPAQVAIGTTYADLGATVTDDKDTNLGVTLNVDGADVTSVSIDTSTAGTHMVVYKTTDSDGNVTQATRTVNVFDPNATSTQTTGGSGSSTDTGSSSTTSTTTSQTSTDNSSSQQNQTQQTQQTSTTTDSTSTTTQTQTQQQTPPPAQTNTGTTTSSTDTSAASSTSQTSSNSATSTTP